MKNLSRASGDGKSGFSDKCLKYIDAIMRIC